MDLISSNEGFALQHGRHKSRALLPLPGSQKERLKVGEGICAEKVRPFEERWRVGWKTLSIPGKRRKALSFSTSEEKGVR